jgi:hypothetical protein
MAKIKLKAPFTEISGTLGDYVFRKGKKDGEVILAKRPKKSEKPSKAQKAHWDRFTEAADYATAALADPDLCAYYEAKAARLDLQPRNVAMADYLNGKNLLLKE